MIALALIYGVFGLIIGSFLNVLVLREGTGKSLGGRSFCDTCGMQLTWRNLIPVFSWIFQRGRCSGCGSRISVQYPLVEAGTGVIFALVGATQLPIIPQIAVFAAFSLLMAISVYDMRHTVIPDAWAYLFGAAALVFSIAMQTPADATAWGLLIAAGPAAALPLAALWLVSGGRWMGLGDAKLTLGIGWLLGPYWGLVALLGAFVIGAAISVCILLPLPHIVRALSVHTERFGAAARGLTMKSEVPFGPFLAASCFLVWYAHYALALPPLTLN